MDRLSEIRFRLDAANESAVQRWEQWPSFEDLMMREPLATEQQAELAAHAPGDIAWLLDEVERVTLERDIAKKWFHRWRRAAWEQSARKAAE